MAVSIGRLNKRITFCKPTTTTGAFGQQTQETYTPWRTVWGTVRQLRSDEPTDAQKVMPYEMYKLTIRYTSGITPQMIAKCTLHGVQHTLELTGPPVDPWSSGELLEITATERRHMEEGDLYDG